MAKTLKLEVTITTTDDADAEQIADYLLDYLCDGTYEALGIQSVDGTDWDRGAWQSQ